MVQSPWFIVLSPQGTSGRLITHFTNNQYLQLPTVELYHTESSWYHHLVFLGLLWQVLTYQLLSGGCFFSWQLLNMLTILRQTDSTDRAGDQSSVRIDRQMCPLLYTWGWTGIFDPPNITSGDSKGYLDPNLNSSWNFSPSYNVPIKIKCVEWQQY